MQPKFYHQRLRVFSTILGSQRRCTQGLTFSRLASTRNKSSEVRIIEVSPRDGLQNIKSSVPTSTKVELVKKLAATGIKDIEATSFVSPKWVPQLADGKEIMDHVLPLAKHQSLRLSVLAPNVRGFENALAAGAKEMVVFASATQEFSRKNQNCSIEKALEAASAVVERAKKNNIWVRGVVSCIFSDPYSGPTDPQDVLFVVNRFLEMGCDEVGLGDTLGVGTPKLTQALLDLILQDVPADKLTGHFHDTYGQAVANIMKSYEMGLRTFDTSVAGLGGCPYAPGAKGNAATEDIVYTLEKSGIDTGIDLKKLAEVGDWISQKLNLPNSSRVGAALIAKQRLAADSCNVKPLQPKPSFDRTTGNVTEPVKHTSLRIWKAMDKTEGYTAFRARSAVKIILTRPKNGNAMTTEMLESLTRLFKELSTDRSVFHIILAAEGKFFCTGMDLTGDSRDSSSTYHDRIVALFQAIDDAPQTTIAAIHGPCYGGGVGLGFACDVRFATEAARWTLSEVKLGVSPAIISKYMAREWGFALFREAMLSGREVTAQELARIGTVHGIAETQEKLHSMVEKYLDRLAYCAPQAAATCKELVRLAFKGPESSQQNTFIRHTFENMLAPGSEGQYGIQKFQQKVKRVDWNEYWESQTAKV